MQYDAVIPPWCDSKYTTGTMSKTILRLHSSVKPDPDESKVRLYCWCMFELEVVIRVRYSSLRGRNRTLVCCSNTLQCRQRPCLYFRWMYGTVSCWLWTNRRYVCIIGACVLDFEDVICIGYAQYEVVITLLCVVSIHYNIDDGYDVDIMFLECIMTRRRFSACWATACAFVFVQTWIWTCYLCSMVDVACTFTHPDVLSKYTTMAMMTDVRLCSLDVLWHGVMLTPWTNRKCVFIHVYLNFRSCCLFVFDTVWGRNNLTLMCCPNTLQ